MGKRCIKEGFAGDTARKQDRDEESQVGGDFRQTLEEGSLSSVLQDSKMGCLRVCPDLMKKLGFHPLIPIGRSLTSTSARSKLPGTSSSVSSGSGRYKCYKCLV